MSDASSSALHALPGAPLRLAAILALLCLAAPALAQLTPSRLYFGVNRAMPMTLEVPAGASGEVEIALFEPDGAEPIEKASAEAGRVDLAGLFPVLWTRSEPGVLYAQAMVGGTQVGAPVVLQPLLTPETAVGGQDARGFPAVNWSPRPTVIYSGIRAYVDRHVVLDTSMGEIEIRLRPDAAANTAFSFRSLVEGGFYTDVVFHRIVPRLQDGSAFVIQGGDPTGEGAGGPGFQIDLERSDLPHDFGVISMARSGDPNSNGSQFFLCLSRKGTARLDGQYTTFGETVRGAEVIRKIAATPLGDERAGRPVEPPVINGARLVDAPPFGQRPAPVVDDEATEPAR